MIQVLSVNNLVFSLSRGDLEIYCLEYLLNYTKLATLAIKVRVEKNKVISAKKITSSKD